MDAAPTATHFRPIPGVDLRPPAATGALARGEIETSKPRPILHPATRPHRTLPSLPLPAVVARTRSHSHRASLPGRSLRFLLLGMLAACGAEVTPDAGPSQTEAAPQVVAEPERAAVRDPVLEAALRAAAAPLEGSVGIAALHLERDVGASLDGDRPFALASVAKLAVAYAALRREDVDPAHRVMIAPGDRAPGETPFGPGTEVTVARLVERSLGHSDNTASDVLLRLAGGPAEVNRHVRELGVEAVRIDRSMKAIFAGWRGIDDVEGIEEWSLAEFDRRAAAVPARVRDEAQAAFASDPRDTGTPEGIVQLLVALQRGEGLRPERRQLLLDALHAAVTGPNRFRAGLPPRTPVAEKTGTLGPLTHDVGIITLPEGAGEVALAVLVQSDAPLAARERIIAAAASAVADHFTGSRAAGPP